MASRAHPLLLAIGATIRRERLARGLSQEGLADAAGVDRSYMSGIERGVRNITVLKLHAVARALGIPAAALLVEQAGEVRSLRSAR